MTSTTAQLTERTETKIDLIPMREQLPPESQIVFTLIDDAKGVRNEALLSRSGNLFFFPDGNMYVYYTPTHWRPATAEELERIRREFESTSANSLKAITACITRLDEQIAAAKGQS